ncbi:dihydroxyacetone kinase subunit DhaL [Variovorax guangxiensis]|jgi:dihydroxyacetone kinase-like protein|uniref:dihydroxyacetone kinase subunit DhaL n=1 Tax=Variovorax guangxiensis TaxID=1775474 RepID=UPI002866EAC6|nr:dihydroxyacetone kinase subunit DhaL [Variovorax guangxiensis]MDR6858069.1 dihydroxyacetone kinase-like protein [Variovorax guangxiensis]
MKTQHIIEAVEAVQAAILANESQIESLDRAIGDGDHFINVRRGCEVLMGLRGEIAPLPPGEAFGKIGMKLLSTIGGASGPLISSFFIAMGKSLAGIAEPDRVQFAAAFAAGVEAIKSRGKADLGEKTMLDVLIPVSRLLQRLAEQGAPLPALCGQLAAEAHRNMLATRDMTATKGRASFLGERAIGHIDPGSKTCEVAIAAVCDTLKEPA